MAVNILIKVTEKAGSREVGQKEAFFHYSLY